MDEQYISRFAFHSLYTSVGRMKCTNNPTTGRALDQSVYEFLVSKTSQNIVFEIKSYLGSGVSGDGDGGTGYKSKSASSSPVPDEDEVLRKRCRMRKWSL